MQDAIAVELFGLPRVVTGLRSIDVPWQAGLTLADVPARLAIACAALQGHVVDEHGQLLSGLIFNLNGRDFLRDPSTPIEPGDTLLLLGADAGGSEWNHDSHL